MERVYESYWTDGETAVPSSPQECQGTTLKAVVHLIVVARLSPLVHLVSVEDKWQCCLSGALSALERRAGVDVVEGTVFASLVIGLAHLKRILEC